MHSLKLLLCALILAGSLGLGQESTPATPPTNESHATVYVYRYKQFVGSGLEPSVYCDEGQLARMDNGRYFTARLDPGKHVFRSNDPQSGVELNVKPGEEYFLRVEIATGFMKGHGRLVLMSPQQAIYELQSAKLKPLDLGKVVDKARVSVEEAHPKAPVAELKPAPVAPPQPAPVPVKATGDDHIVSGVLISDPDRVMGTTSMEGDQDPLGDAARRNRDKRRPPK